MVVLGHPTTVPVTLDDMVHHCRAVARGASSSSSASASASASSSSSSASASPLLVGDLPFGTYVTVDKALESSARLIQDGGMQAVKLEGGRAQAPKISRVVAEGIPVMGHVGLLPQTAALGGAYALRGKTGAAAMACVEDALAAQEAGAFSVVIEMVPAQLASFVTSLLRKSRQSASARARGAGARCSSRTTCWASRPGPCRGS
jgi:3-methyl-2-oxobutanoate hydroxymethyltransferase